MKHVVLLYVTKLVAINKQTERLFIAIAKQDKHSFVMLGTYNNNKVTHLLCRVGKSADEDIIINGFWDYCGELIKIISSRMKAKISDEGLSKESYTLKPISYQAYEITYAQYLEFVQLLEAIQTNDNKFKCYKPTKEQKREDEISMELTNNPVCPERNVSGALSIAVSEFGINNTCRHGAIKLVEEVQRARISSLVSSYYFRDLPYKSHLYKGKPTSTTPFYVLPISPTAYPNLDREKRKVVEKLYHRMEHMLLLEPNSLHTQNKFQTLKNLYTEILGPQQELNLDQLLGSIKQWKMDNIDNLTSLRKTYIWDFFITRKSATLLMTEEIEKSLSAAVSQRN